MEKKLDEIRVPKFFKMKAPEGTHKDSFEQVFAENSDHFTKGWVTVGFVSKQTPLGQGTSLGFDKKELRKATKKEVLAALRQDHPHGYSFRPSCSEAANANFHLLMSIGFGNWTNDNPDHSPVINASRAEIENFGKAAQERHQKLMENWGSIRRGQIRAIKKALSAY